MAPPGRQNAPRASPSLRSAMPTGCCAPQAASTAKAAARPSSPANAARLSADFDGSCLHRRDRTPRQCRFIAAMSPLLSARNLSIDEVAASAGTIGYEVLTRLGRRAAIWFIAAAEDICRWRRARQNFVCQNCGAAYARWAGKCEACGEWNTLVEEGAAATTRRSSRKGRLFAVETLKGQKPRSAAACLRHGRIRSRDRRRPGARLGAAARRRSRHRQIDAADRGRGRLCARRSSRRLYFRRRSGGAGAAARRAARARRRAGRARRRDLGRGHRGDALARRDAAASGHRFDPDHVDRKPSKRRPAR